MFREAAQQSAHWRESHHPNFQISVNMSPVQFRNAGVGHKTWVNYLHTLGIPGEGVVIEITEGLLMDASEGITNQLLEFRDAGMQVALDDFGTGYSSLSYIKKFDIDYLKIDQSFVRNLAPDSSDLALCEAIIVMAHKLGIKVIAEGVETELQRSLLGRRRLQLRSGHPVFPTTSDGGVFELPQHPQGQTSLKSFLTHANSAYTPWEHFKYPAFCIGKACDFSAYSKFYKRCGTELSAAVLCPQLIKTGKWVSFCAIGLIILHRRKTRAAVKYRLRYFDPSFSLDAEPRIF